MNTTDPVPGKKLLVACWLALVVYAFTKDIRAALIGITITPAFYFYFRYALRSKSQLLIVISIFAFAGHGLGSIFFFINHQNYTYSGFSAIKDYDFNLVSFYWYYAQVLFLFYLTAYIVRRKSYSKYKYSSADVESPLRVSLRSSLILGFFVYLIITPLYIIFFINGIGIQGGEIIELPFKLTGLMYYGRLVIIPIFVFYLYRKAGHSLFSISAVLVFSFAAGVTSASRMAFLMSALPIVFYALNNPKNIRSVLILLIVFFGVQVVSLAREFLYFGSENDLISVLFNAINLFFSSDSDSLITVFGYIMNRFYGPQDIVLASQYIVTEPIIATFRYFLSGGEMGSVIPNLNEDFFGVELTGEAANFGLGLGTFTILYMLFSSNIVAGFAAAYALAFIIKIGDRVIWKFSSKRYAFSVRGLDKILLVVTAFYIYSSTLKLAFYIFLALFLVSKFIGRQDKRIPNRISSIEPR